jgi:hypothetical protein
MWYVLRKYTFVQTRIKDMSNFVNLKLIVNYGETKGDSTGMVGENVFDESPMGFEAW